MGVRVLPAWVAVIAAAGLALLLVVPYVARRYRRHGDMGAGDAVLAFAFLLYVMGLVAYVMVPLPPIGPDFCQYYGWIQPQWQPFHIVQELPEIRGWAGVPQLLGDSNFRQFALNVAFFVPLGMFCRYLFRRSVFGCILIGFSVSLLVELTQLTGIWYLYPCPFRIFDVDDLIANTLGATVGIIFAPLLRLIPFQRRSDDPQAARPVTASRRLLGIVCDVLLVWWTGSVFLVLATFVGLNFPWYNSILGWWAPAVMLLLFTVSTRGTTPGQHIVRLKSVMDGRRAGYGAILMRWLVGLGAFAGLQGLAEIWPIAGFAALGLAVVHVLLICLGTQHRGITGLLSGLQIIDARSIQEQSQEQHKVG